MSRQGKKPIDLLKDVTVQVNKDNQIVVKGPKGTLTQELINGISIEVKDEKVFVINDDAILPKSSKHGLYRALIINMVEGVTKGFEKKLQLIGTGFRAQTQGNKLDIKAGFSHPTLMDVPKELSVEVDKKGIITVAGMDKQLVGQFAASIRAKRPPEPYKGKGIRYIDEYVRKKAGKASKTK